MLKNTLQNILYRGKLTKYSILTVRYESNFPKKFEKGGF